MGAKRTVPSGPAQQSGLAVPATPPLGRVNQKDTFSLGVMLVAVKATVCPGSTVVGLALPSLLPEGSQDCAEAPPAGEKRTSARANSTPAIAIPSDFTNAVMLEPSLVFLCRWIVAFL